MRRIVSRGPLGKGVWLAAAIAIVAAAVSIPTFAAGQGSSGGKVEVAKKHKKKRKRTSSDTKQDKALIKKEAAKLRGPKGSKGAKGDTGPSSVSEAFNDTSTFVTITGTTEGTANSVATLSNLSPGAYLVISRTQANVAGTNSARVICETTLGGRTVQGIATIGSASGAAGQVPITTTFDVTLSAAGTANVKCWAENLSGSSPFASATYIEALRVGSATSQPVSS
jgi:hypothetical protein